MSAPPSGQLPLRARVWALGGPIAGTVLITLAAIAITRYTGLHEPAAAIRPLPFEYFQQTLLPIGCAHALMLLALRLLPAGRTFGAAGGYWLISFVVVFWFAGAARSAAFGAALLVLFVCALIGGSLLRWAAMAPNPALSTAVGISTVSVLATLLVSAGWFKAWVVAPLLFGWAALEIARSRSAWIARGRSLRAVLKKPIGLAEVCSVEIAFLLLVFVVVQASAPEQRSDAVRFYLPYVKLLALTGRFPDVDNQWSFVIPQPGITWAATFQLLFGSMTSRFASVAALATLVWLATMQIGRTAVGLAVACAVASVPLVLWTSTSLMQDTFASLVVVCTVVFLLNDRACLSSLAAAFLGGMLLALALAAKYMIVFAIPAIVIFVVRSLRNGERRAAFRGSASAVAGALLAIGPWLMLASRRTGSALFPLFLDQDPHSVWPSFTEANLGEFALPRSVAGWLAAPFLMTFDSSRFVEGLDGAIGVTFLLLCLTIPLLAIFRLHRLELLFLVSGSVGALALWAFTAYGRYWLPAQWLLAICAGAALARITSGSRGGDLLVVAMGAVVVAAQVPLAMAMSWKDPAGFAWDFFSRRISYNSYVARYPGTAALLRLRQLDPLWARVWFTGVEQIGHFPVVPMEASVWEFRSRHGIEDAESAGRYIERARADYWIVNHSDAQARYFEELDVPRRYWPHSRLLFQDGTIAVYWMPFSARGRATARRNAPSILPEIVLSRNADFELGDSSASEWHAIGDGVTVVGAAHTGRRSLSVSGSSAAVQRVTLPNAAAAVVLEEHIRCDEPLFVRLQVNWLNEKKLTTGTHIDVIRCDADWTRYFTRTDIPDDARYAEVFLTNHSPAGVSHFDNVTLKAIVPQ